MASGDRIKIVIADDHQLVRTKIRDLLERCPDFLVIGEAENGIEAIQKVRENNPDVLLLDIHMPIIDGIETLEIIRKTDHQTVIIILSAFENKFFLYETITKGANGYILKDDAPASLVEAIMDCVRNKKLIISPQIHLKNIVGSYSALP